VRGEHMNWPRLTARLSGAPPRARGTRECVAVVHAPQSEHPRVRGEHANPRGELLLAIGAPPRARGTHADAGQDVAPGRSTPACAGNTRLPLPHGARAPEHPRVRGEHWYRREGLDDRLGAPPRARGTPTPEVEGCHVARSTPACAGNTVCCGYSSRAGAEHPRVRGEHMVITAGHVDCYGAPPRARGTRARWSRGAGSETEHPRVRGEHGQDFRRWRAGDGAPPRARGTLREVLRREARRRSTPACAGNTPP